MKRWNDVYSCSDVNLSLEAFLATFIHYFNIAFPLKRKHLWEWPNKMRLSKGLSVSRKRLQTLNNLKRTVTLRTRLFPMWKTIKDYIKKY